MISYEDRLSSNLEWALTEGSIFFENRGAVQTAMRRIAKRLDELGIPYAVAGGMALFAHGFRRFTEDVDIVLSQESLKIAHRELEGRGYLKKQFAKTLRDTELGVGIDFLITGQFPGDGKPKPIAFPDPSDVAVEIDGIRYLNLESLVSLKLASGMSGRGRGKDIGDVEQLIDVLSLPEQFAERLDPFVRDEFFRIWRSMHGETTRYVTLWRNKLLTVEATSLEEMSRGLRTAAEKLQAMLADGVVLDASGGAQDDYALLVTTNPDIAKKYDMIPEEEFFVPDEDSDKPSQ